MCFSGSTAQSPAAALDPLQQAYAGMQHYTGWCKCYRQVTKQLGKRPTVGWDGTRNDTSNVQCKCAYAGLEIASDTVMQLASEYMWIGNRRRSGVCCRFDRHRLKVGRVSRVVVELILLGFIRFQWHSLKAPKCNTANDTFTPPECMIHACWVNGDCNVCAPD